MAFDPATQSNGSQYLPVIPEAIEAPRDYVGMPEVLFIESNGDRVKVMMYEWTARKLRDALNSMDLGDSA